jgi:hypothetical protein
MKAQIPKIVGNSVILGNAVLVFDYTTIIKDKGPRHGEVLGERKYSSTHSLTSALYGGEWSASSPE